MASQQYAVIGLGEFGRSVLNTLVLEGCDVIALDSDHNKIQEVSNIVMYAVTLDATDENALISKAGIKSVDVAIVGVGKNIQDSVMITLLLKELGVKKIIAKAVNLMHGKVLTRIGAHKVVYPEIDMGERVAKSVLSKNVFEQIEIIKDYSVVEILVPERYEGMKVKDSNIRSKYNINIIAVLLNYNETAGKKTSAIIPQADYVFQKDDVLLVFGDDKDITKFKK